MLSFIIPAHNEEALIGDTIAALCTAAKSAGVTFEVIVVDDGSSDRTAEIARSFRANVVSVNVRHIAAARNAGARVARGEVLVFVDADTIVPARTLTAMIERLKRGAVGGGARIKLDGEVPGWGRLMTRIVTAAYFQMQLAPGCFLFARRGAFEAVGGFNEEYFASEEVHLSRALHMQGRFVILRDAVTTSGRKFRLYSPWGMFQQVFTIARGGLDGVKQRDRLGMWYESPREKAAGARVGEQVDVGFESSQSPRLDTAAIP